MHRKTKTSLAIATALLSPIMLSGCFQDSGIDIPPPDSEKIPETEAAVQPYSEGKILTSVFVVGPETGPAVFFLDKGMYGGNFEKRLAMLQTEGGPAQYFHEQGEEYNKAPQFVMEDGLSYFHDSRIGSLDDERYQVYWDDIKFRQNLNHQKIDIEGTHVQDLFVDHPDSLSNPLAVDETAVFSEGAEGYKETSVANSEKFLATVQKPSDINGDVVCYDDGRKVIVSSMDNCSIIAYYSDANEFLSAPSQILDIIGDTVESAPEMNPMSSEFLKTNFKIVQTSADGGDLYSVDPMGGATLAGSWTMEESASGNKYISIGSVRSLYDTYPSPLVEVISQFLYGAAGGDVVLFEDNNGYVHSGIHLRKGDGTMMPYVMVNDIAKNDILNAVKWGDPYMPF